VIRHLTFVVLTVALEGSHEVVTQDGRRNNFLTLLGLWARLCVVLAHVGVVCGTEANRRLLALVANVDTHEHGLVADLGSKRHAPQVAAELSVHLSDNVKEDAVIVLGDRAVSHELRNHWRVAVNLVLNE